MTGRRRSLMFTKNGERLPTWNPIFGCLYRCQYCWARDWAEKRHGRAFNPEFRPWKLRELKSIIHRNPGKEIFVCDYGEMWGSWVPDKWIKAVLNECRRYPKATFLFLTKNPARYYEFLDELPENSILGATLESNIDWGLTRAPSPYERYRAMRDLPWRNKMVSIEPVLDFNLETMVKWIREIRPVFIYIGYDNHNKRLPEPLQAKTRKLVERLGEFTEVRLKTIRKAWYE